MAEPTRPLPNPRIAPNGEWVGKSVTTPISFNIRGRLTIPRDDVVPVIVVPGIMGTNLRAKRTPRNDAERNQEVAPGAPAWRPPNGIVAGMQEARRWSSRKPRVRQRLLDGTTLEVDDTGSIYMPLNADDYGLDENEGRTRWWGEVHADSYGRLLAQLEIHLNHTFGFDSFTKKRFIQLHWEKVMRCSPEKWGVRTMAPLTEKDLEKHASFYYPVYACGYNWLGCCSESAERLQQRILDIIRFWTERKKRCKQVILVTHSMGGLVARACAKLIPDKIAGVIHGVMPAFGAPACYRRIACGTETSSPSNGVVQNQIADVVATILGKTSAETTAVMATSVGALELLPTHLYPGPWLNVSIVTTANGRDHPRTVLRLPTANDGSPYGLYEDQDAWYRVIDPALADPAKKFGGGIAKKVNATIRAASTFHTRTLGEYYHPNTYAFYGADSDFLSFGEMHWVARYESNNGAIFTAANVHGAKFLGYAPGGGRRVLIEGRTELTFEPAPQNGAGDGTVPRQSGAGPTGKIKKVFETRGYDHQGSYNNEEMLLLTQYLIAKIVQGLP